jgi:hypothetical protein
MLFLPPLAHKPSPEARTSHLRPDFSPLLSHKALTKQQLTALQKRARRVETLHKFALAAGNKCRVTEVVGTKRSLTLSCVISVNRSHQTVFSLTSGSLCGLTPRKFDVVTFVGFARVASEVGREYSKVNFALFWRLLRLANSLALTRLGETSFRLVFSDFMLVEGTQSIASEFGLSLPKRAVSPSRVSEHTHLRPFAFLTFARKKRSLQRRSRRKVSSLRVGRILNQRPR